MYSIAVWTCVTAVQLFFKACAVFLNLLQKSNSCTCAVRVMYGTIFQPDFYDFFMDLPPIWVGFWPLPPIENRWTLRHCSVGNFEALVFSTNEVMRGGQAKDCHGTWIINPASSKSSLAKMQTFEQYSQECKIWINSNRFWNNWA